MASTAFAASLPFILRWEGGYVDHPNDPGGPTNRGVTQVVYDRWRERQGLPTRSVKAIEDTEVEAIYETDYWLPPRCDLLRRQLDLVQFDTAVNMGAGRAVRFLQAAVGCSVAYYRRLAAARPKLGVFLKGWTNRVNALRAEVGLAGFEAAVPLDFGDTGYIARIPDIGVDGSYDIEEH